MACSTHPEVDLEVASDLPSQVTESLKERGMADPGLWVVRGDSVEHTNAPHRAALLRLRRQRPHRRAAEQRDELAAFHCPMPPVLATERIAHLSYCRDCCAAGFQSRL